MAAESEAFLRGVQLRHLRCLVAVAQERHLARAAERLALSQPAVSKTLAELEALVGERLVDRGTAGRRGIQGFTAVGEQLLAHALRVLDALDAGAQALMPASGARLQRLRVGALPSVAPSLLPPALVALRERLPALQLQLQVQTGANAALLDALRAGELDLVVGRMSDPQLMAGLTFELLYTEPLALVARAGHPLARRAPSVQEVLQQPLVVYAEGTIPRHHTESFLSGLGLRLPPHVTQTLDLSVARALLVRSDAVWFTPIGAAQDDLASGLLVRLAVDTAGTEEPVGLLLRSDAEPSAARQALIALLREAGGEPQSLRVFRPCSSGAPEASPSRRKAQP